MEEAYQHHADVMVYRAKFSDWMTLAETRALEYPVVQEESYRVEPA